MTVDPRVPSPAITTKLDWTVLCRCASQDVSVQREWWTSMGLVFFLQSALVHVHTHFIFHCLVSAV